MKNPRLYSLRADPPIIASEFGNHGFRQTLKSRWHRLFRLRQSYALMVAVLVVLAGGYGLKRPLNFPVLADPTCRRKPLAPTTCCRSRSMIRRN